MDTTLEKKDIKIKKFDRTILLYAYIFLLLPFILFLLFWTKFYIGITATLFACVGFYFIFKAKREYKDIFLKDYKKKLIAIAVISFIWTLLSGQGGLFFQNIDYNMRNAIFYDLVKFDWPVIYNIPANIIESVAPNTTAYESALLFSGKQLTIVYYLGFWLPPALIGKAFYASFGTAGLAF